MNTSKTAALNKSTKQSMLLALIPMTGVLLALKPFFTILACIAIISSINILSIKNSAHRKGITLLALFFFITLTGLFIASKESSFSVGNDKYQYIEYMKSMEHYGFVHQIQYHPEPVSFGILHLSNLIFGYGNTTFLLIFILSLSLVSVGAWRLLQEKSALFILLLMSSSILLVTYGNTIRQAISISLLVLAVSFTGRKLIAILSLSLLAHLSSALIIPLVLLAKRKNIQSTKLTLTILIASCLISFAIPEIIESLKLSGINIIETKASLYEAWDSYDTTKTKIMFYVLLAATIVANHFRNRLTIKTPALPNQAYTYLWALLISTSAIMMATQSIDKIFERYYPAFFIAAILYLCLYVSRLNKPYLRLLSSTVLAIYSTYSILKNITSDNLFYCGHPASFLQADIFSIANCL